MMPAAKTETLLLTKSDVESLLLMEVCIAAVEEAFRAYAMGAIPPPGILGTHVEGGGFHIKTAVGGASYAAKINANFPQNPSQRGLPTIQGMVALFDAQNGRLLALMDSISITRIRTAAATGVAAKYLGREDAAVVTVVGCGVQASAQVAALCAVRPIRRVLGFDLDAAKARKLVEEVAATHKIEAEPAGDLQAAIHASDVCISCTPSKKWIIGREHAHPGLFIAGVGADSDTKQELEPELLRRAKLVVDIREQCATIGDLHHALDAGVMTMTGVHADLGELAAGKRPGRESADEITIFDSTGAALQDLAAATAVYQRALAAGKGTLVNFQE